MTSTRHTAPLICLIGYRGAGKTTVARSLSSRLGWPWLDADVEVTRVAGASIKEIFEQEGEAGFRSREAATIADLTGRDQLIVAVGGGAVLRDDNRRALRRGLVIWLQADSQTLWRRLSADPLTPSQRPNLAGGGQQEIEQILATRRSLYQQCADHAIETVGCTPDQVVDQIVGVLAPSGDFS